MLTMLIAAGIIGLVILIFKAAGIALIVVVHCIKSLLSGYRKGYNGEHIEYTEESPPTVSEALKENAASRWKAYKKSLELPYYIADQISALEAQIENVYVRISELEAEREYTFNQSRLIEIDKKTAALQLEAARKTETIEKLIAKYRG